ncbi:MAG: flavodoxin [Verrucomicrobia bacterium]|jgi:flavodoxin I|nr:flavodoxin [Verrucomicrobiota bacterium]
MNILVTYFSQTGNTETVAKAICDECATVGTADLKRLKDITPNDMARYDFIFVGSPLHAGRLAAPMQEYLRQLRSTSGQKMAGFITHFAAAYPEQSMEGFAEPIKTACKKNGIEFRGCFDCQGALSERLHGVVQKKLNATDEAWAEMLSQMTGHPNAEDKDRARAFARKMMDANRPREDRPSTTT